MKDEIGLESDSEKSGCRVDVQDGEGISDKDGDADVEICYKGNEIYNYLSGDQLD